MKKLDKQVAAFAMIFIFAGLIAIIGSYRQVTSVSTSTSKKLDNTPGYVVTASDNNPIVYGTGITRFYNASEEVTMDFSTKLKPPILDSVDYTFEIVSPDGNETFFVFSVNMTTNPASETAPPIIAISDFYFLNVSGLVPNNSSITGFVGTPYGNFIGTAIAEGNYSLIFRSDYRLSPLNAMQLYKVITTTTEDVERTHPYASSLPIGATILVIGAVPGLWVLSRTRQQRIRRRVKK